MQFQIRRPKSETARHDEGEGRTLRQVLASVSATERGLSAAEAASRLRQFGGNRLQDDSGNHPLAVLLRQFRSPMVLILLAAAALSLLLGDVVEGSLVVGIVVASAALGFVQEFRAGAALAELRRRIAVTSTVLREGVAAEVPAAEIVPGDQLLLDAGSMVPADAVLLACSALNVDEAALTGESFPVAKSAAVLGEAVSADMIVHMGTSVRSGEGRAVVIATGTQTEFGQIAHAVSRTEPETSFARGTRRFGLLMTQVMLVLVTLVLVLNVLLGRPALDSLLFAAALAVGITPELLPAIVTVTLSQGAKRLAAHGVLVRRLVAIENLGAMDVLCTDKTGTLTTGEVKLANAFDVAGHDSPAVLRLAAINAGLQSATPNPIDEAILDSGGTDWARHAEKLGEVPYDFDRRRLSVLVRDANAALLVCKGAVGAMLPICTGVALDGGTEALGPEGQAREEERLRQWSEQGFRVLAIATKTMPAEDGCAVADEAGMTLAGYLLFADPLKPGIAETVAALARNGIALKILSGDNRYVAAHVAEAVGLSGTALVTGADLAGLNPRMLARRIVNAEVFAEVTPDQKERIIAALRKAERTVGYLGDGINDAPALRTADAGISVDSAVDAAKAAADIILLQPDLNVLLDGIIAGRIAFGNTIKYVAITISANVGNMISMAAASLLLPFLPMLAMQVLLNNALSDLPMLTISTDKVDPELLARPRSWDFGALLRAMLGFGLLSSAFDFLTFLLLLQWFQAGEELFQTGWFVESLLTELAVVAVMRTSRPMFRSLPSRLLVVTSAAVAAAAVFLPYLPFAPLLGFTALPVPVLGAVVGIVLLYVAASEVLKDRLSVLRSSSDKPAVLRA